MTERALQKSSLILLKLFTLKVHHRYVRNFRVLVKQVFYGNEAQFQVSKLGKIVQRIPLEFPTLKLEIEFHSHKKVVSPKLENSAYLSIVNFK